MRFFSLALTAAALLASSAALAQTPAGFSPAATVASFVDDGVSPPLMAPGADTARRVSFSAADLATQTWPFGAPAANFIAPTPAAVASAFSPANLAALRGPVPAEKVTVTVVAQR